MKVLIVYYSMYGHINRMAEAIAEGAKTVKGAEVMLRRVPETLSQEVLVKMGAVEAQKKFENVPVATVDELASADAIIFGTPTRFGNMCGQMRQFLDATGGLWAKGAWSERWAVSSRVPQLSTGGRNPPCSAFTSLYCTMVSLLLGCHTAFKGKCVTMKSRAAHPMERRRLLELRARELRLKMNCKQLGFKAHM